MEDTAESSVDEFIGETLPPPPPLPKLDPASLSLLPIRPHSSLSSSLLASSSPRGLLTSSCLNELDLSAPPFGDDLPDEPHDSFRSKVLLALDNVKGLALCLRGWWPRQMRFRRLKCMLQTHWRRRQTTRATGVCPARHGGTPSPFPSGRPSTSSGWPP